MTATVDDLKMMLCEALIETGTYNGDGIRNALQAGFKRVRSVEIDLAHFRKVEASLKETDPVSLYLGDSKSLLGRMLADEPASRVAVVLDAHPYPGDPTIPDGTVPLLHELAILKDFSSKLHAICIDDVPWLEGRGFHRQLLIELLKCIGNFNIHETSEHVWVCLRAS